LVVEDVVDDEFESEDDEPPKVEVGGEVEVMEGITGIVVEVLFKQVSELPEATVIGGAALPTPLESLSTTTTLVPEEIAT